jgi:N-6 DNA Methylase
VGAAQVSTAERLGVPAEAFVDFRERPSARHLRYMDLLSGFQGPTADGQDSLEGVVEVSGKAALYVVRSSVPALRGADASIVQLMRSLACRADACHLAVLRPGTMTVYRVGFYADGQRPAVDVVIDGDDPLSVRKLLNGGRELTRQERANRLWLDDLLFDLLTRAADGLRNAVPGSTLSDGEVLSLIGRALFTRFLVDRGIVKPHEVDKIVAGVQRPEDLFGTVDALVGTFEWLDRTFNGDLLDLGTKDYRGYLYGLGRASRKVCATLSNIMVRSTDGQLSLDWSGLRFEHIPVDVLSQVYEHFAHRFMPEHAHATSIHYTPRDIAALLVDGVFAATPAPKRHLARVLDPAAGAGVFLVLAFRRLVAEQWRHTGRRPQRAAIRKILTEQLCGLDINPTSVKVAALSLYLAALELDPQPQPLSDLKFEHLFDSTLHCVEADRLGGAVDAKLGSLSARLSTWGPFDIVLANPPWNSLDAKFRKQLESIAPLRPASLGGMDSLTGKSPVPHQWPDVAFMWRSLQWCRPGGVIGMIVHARLLFSDEATEVRARWFSLARVTGVLNGMFLRKERHIWPSNSQPFCAVVALNELPQPDDSFYYLSPRLEPALGQNGEFRLDPRSAMAVPLTLAARERHVFKTLARGSALDLDLVGRLGRAPRIPLRDYFEQLGVALRQGFIAGNRQQHADALHGLPILEGDDKPEYAVEVAGLEKTEQRFPELKLERPRDPAIYRGPHVLFRQAPKLAMAQRGAVSTDGDLAYSRSFYGVPLSRCPKVVSDFMYVVSYSDLFLYWSLMTSSQFGVERETFNVADVESLPVPPMTALVGEVATKISDVAERIRAGGAPWQQVKRLTAEVYGLSTFDQQLIEDVIAHEAPYPKTLAAGLREVPRNGEAVQAFGQVLASTLAELDELSLSVWPHAVSNDDGPWQFLRMGVDLQRSPDLALVQRLLKLVREPLQASEIRLQLGDQDWLIGRIRHARYWTRSEARLLALDLVDDGLLTRPFLQ